MRLLLGALIIISALAIITTRARADGELVIAIRYLQAEGASHSHLYLYREDGKVLRQRTNDNSGQNVAPIFDPIGETIVLRARSRIRRPSIGQSSRGDGLKKLDVAASWYVETKTSPHFTNVDSEAESPATAECVTGTNRLA